MKDYKFEIGDEVLIEGTLQIKVNFRKKSSWTRTVEGEEITTYYNVYSEKGTCWFNENMLSIKKAS